MAKSDKGLSDAEKAALKERAAELKAEGKRGKGKDKRAAGEKDLLAKIAEMPEADRVMAEKVHAIVSEVAPHLLPKTMYGMPAYANKAGKVVCFFQAKSKWDTRNAALVFEDTANLDEGSMWPTSFAIRELTAENERRIAELMRRAVS